MFLKVTEWVGGGKMEHPRVIILQTTPYSTNNSSRTLDAYFHYWEKDKVRQIFSRNWKPQKGHCGELYQITDASLLKRWLHRSIETGKVYRYEDLEEQGNSEILADKAAVAYGYKIGKSHTPTVELLRGILWRKTYWCTAQLTEWLDEYKPELVFYNFTYNLFLAKIAIFIAERYNIPIITAVADDYYFNDVHGIKLFSVSNQLFKMQYKATVRKLFAHKGSAVFGCDKIRDKYTSSFGINGETIYYNSTVERRQFKTIDLNSPVFVYFGNIRLGRNRALLDIANALLQISPNIKLKIFSNETDSKYYQDLREHPSVVWGGAIPYEQVKKEIIESDVYVVVESFYAEDINLTRYSLSTKAADGLMSGLIVLGYGSMESGVISYLNDTKAAMVCTSPEKIKNTIKQLIIDQQLQKQLYEQSKKIAKANHTLESSTKKFETILEKTLKI